MSRYVSAFFQDIVSQQGYAYRYEDGTYASRKDVLRENPEHLRLFFSKQQWRDVIWLNPEFYVESASVALGGTSFVSRKLSSLVRRASQETDSKYDKIWPVRVSRSSLGKNIIEFPDNVEMYVLRFHRLDRDVRECLGMLNFPRVRPPHTNRGADKWYSAQYNAVLKLVLGTHNNKDSEEGGEKETKHRDRSNTANQFTIQLDL